MAATGVAVDEKVATAVATDVAHGHWLESFSFAENNQVDPA